MNSSSSSSSLSQNSPLSFSSQVSDAKDPVSSAIFPIHRSFELNHTDSELVTTTTTHPHSRTRKLFLRASRNLARHFPRTHACLTRVLLYARGPRPKIDLPEPVPWLDISTTIHGRRISLPIESTILRHTQRFSSTSFLLLIGAAWLIGLAFLSRAQSFLTPPSSFIGCTSTYWLANAGCGQDGSGCGPFTNSSFQFRCPARCKAVILQNPRTVGAEQVAFVPLIVGGGDELGTYRGDSFICAAAEQAGIISDSKGGCGSLDLIGNFTDFVPFSAHDLTSIGFPSVFPLSFRFSGSNMLPHCTDLRDDALTYNALATVLLFLALRPAPIVRLWVLACIGFWHVALFSQAHGPPPQLDTAFGAFLPALFVVYAYWRLAIRFTMPAFARAPFEACVLYVGPFWVGVLTNLIFDRIPISRLTSADLHKRSGAIGALVAIIIVVFFIVLNQVRVIRKTGWLPYYLGWYILGGLIAMVLALLPGLQFRLHHYILSMALIPGTAFPTRLSAIYQGFLLGLFLNGVSAFGFDPIVQTAEALRQDAPIGSLLPTFLTNSTNYNTSIPLMNQTIFWDVLPDGWDGFALLVDDVQRYAGTALNFSTAALDPTIPHFLRLALTSEGTPGDFTMAAIIWPNGTWVDPLPGPS